MKQSSYPPFIVFFDTLAIFLFLLILNQQNNPSEVILISPEKIFSGGKLIYKENGKYYNEGGSPYHKNIDKGIYLFDCIEQKECKNLKASKKNIENTFILLPDRLLEEMSFLTFKALNSKICASIKFFVTNEGELDYKMMADASPCILKINGIIKKIEKYEQEAINQS